MRLPAPLRNGSMLRWLCDFDFCTEHELRMQTCTGLDWSDVQSWSVLSPLRWWPSRRGSESVHARLWRISHSLPSWIWIFCTNGANMFSAVLLAQLSHRFISCKPVSLFYHLLSWWSPITVLSFCLSSWPPAVHHRWYLSSFHQYFTAIQKNKTRKLKSCLHIKLYLFFVRY